jgi:hypothetical protein
LRRLSGIGVDTGRMVLDLSGGVLLSGGGLLHRRWKGATCPDVHVTVVLLARHSFYSLLGLVYRQMRPASLIQSS